MQRKKLEAEEKHLKQRKAKEEFIKMLEVWSIILYVIINKCYFVLDPCSLNETIVLSGVQGIDIIHEMEVSFSLLLLFF